MADQIIIVGASHAGISCAEQLRANGYAGRICIIDRLVGAPLERPPLSKTFLQASGQDDAKFLLRRLDWFAAHDIELLDGRNAVSVNSLQKQLFLQRINRHRIPPIKQLNIMRGKPIESP